MRDSSAVLMRAVECRVILNGVRIEDDDVRDVALLQTASLANLQRIYRKGCQSAYGFLERDDLFVANILAEEAGEVAVGAGMGIRFQKDAFRRHRAGVRVEHHPRQRNL